MRLCGVDHSACHKDKRASALQVVSASGIKRSIGRPVLLGNTGAS
jgi:hypothetical protein